MANLRQAVWISALATGAAAAVWMMFARRSDQTTRFNGARTNLDLSPERSRSDEIEELTQQQKDLMLRELSDHI